MNSLLTCAGLRRIAPLLATTTIIFSIGCADYGREFDQHEAVGRVTVTTARLDAFGMALKTPEEIDALKVKALAGDEEAMSLAIDTFILGIGVDIDEHAAYLLAEQGSAMGMIDAKASLGRALTQGVIAQIPKDESRGKQLLEEAAEAGNERATRLLAYDLLPEDRAARLERFDHEHGIKDARTALAIVEACRQAVALTDPAEALESGLRCRARWIELASSAPVNSLPTQIALERVLLSEDAQKAGISGFGNPLRLMEAGLGLTPASRQDAVSLAELMLKRAHWAGLGTHAPKNYELQNEYAIRVTALESLFPDVADNSLVIDALLELWAAQIDGRRENVLHAMRAYGWFLLRKSRTGSGDWTLNSESALQTQKSLLTPELVSIVEDAVAQWEPGNDLDFSSAGGKGRAGESKLSYGTAFYISKDGVALTNAHVAEGCKTIKGRDGALATLVAMDEANDLAAVRFRSFSEGQFARLEAGSKLPRIGDHIAVFGFPLSEVLASTGNLTAGNVSANSGLDNNSSMFQISAPIQPGSSGSPVLSMRGNVAGVISATASTVRLTQATGTIPQNLNFAINKDTVVGFLRSNGIPFEEAGDGFFSGGNLEVAEIGEHAREWTIRIECER